MVGVCGGGRNLEAFLVKVPMFDFSRERVEDWINQFVIPELLVPLVCTQRVFQCCGRGMLSKQVLPLRAGYSVFASISRFSASRGIPNYVASLFLLYRVAVDYMIRGYLRLVDGYSFYKIACYFLWPRSVAKDP